MGITYPLTLPTSIGMASITLRSTNAVALSSSPFTYAQKVYAYSGQKWSASVTIPPVRRDTAEPWIAFLTALRGQYGTFLMGDPNATSPQGAASGTLLVNGGSQAGGSIICDGAYEIGDLENYADDSTFEDGTTHPWDLDGTYTFISSATGAEGSAKSLALRPTDGVTTIATLDRSIPVQEGDVIYLETWVRPDASFDGTTENRFRVGSQDGTLLASLNFNTSNVTASTWQKISNTLTIPNGVTGLSITIRTNFTAGFVYLDNIVIRKKPPIFKAGDYVQLGATAATRTLHKVLQDVVPDDSGNFTMEIWPHVRTSPADNATITYTNTVGRWRLASNETEFSIDSATKYGISFDCVEAI